MDLATLLSVVNENFQTLNRLIEWKPPGWLCPHVSPFLPETYQQLECLQQQNREAICSMVGDLENERLQEGNP